MTSAPPADAVATVAPAPTPGDALRTARMAQQLTIEQLSTELRIEARQLQALEENRFEQIGVPVFVKGYLRQYGQRLGVNQRDLLALYDKQTKLAEVQIQPSRTIKLRDERQVTVWVLAMIVLLVIIVGIAVWWWNEGELGFSLPTFTSELRSTTEAAPATAPAASPPPAPAPAPVIAPPPAVVATPVVAVTADPAVVAAPAAEVTVANAAPAESPPLLVEPPVTTLPLELTFVGESWAEVTDGRGERLFYGLGAAGQRVTASGEPPFAIVFGNADAVQLVVDGEPYPVPSAGRQGDLARFAVDIAEE